MRQRLLSIKYEIAIYIKNYVMDDFTRYFLGDCNVHHRRSFLVTNIKPINGLTFLFNYLIELLVFSLMDPPVFTEGDWNTAARGPMPGTAYPSAGMTPKRETIPTCDVRSVAIELSKCNY